MQSLRNRCGFLMLVKLRQIECVQGFVLLMYNFLEMLGKFMEFLLPSDNAVHGDSLRLFPVRALDPLNRMRGWQRGGTSWDLSGTGRTRSLKPSRSSSPWSPFPE